MNDPRVVSLHKKIEHASWIDYFRAGPFKFGEQEFDVRVADELVRFSMNDHFATEQEARDTVEEFIRGWELDAALARGHGAFKLQFDKSEMVDRNPTPGVIQAQANPARFTFSTSPTQGTGSPRDYPRQPSIRLTPSPGVESMFLRYAAYRGGREPLAPMAYFCLEVLLASTGKRRGRLVAAARRYRISQRVLNRLADLTSSKGGAGARKAEGAHQELTAQEKRFVEAAVTTIIRRAAEVAHDPDAELPEISMSELLPPE